ncbi:glycosyltransferase family 4 protein [Terrimonas pollutisoli]|uniref:glycosyltransferase family 4 protein n=1 Tax=Terrimonas pollutisoli TaxID=3034147 RepID=UPI0023EC8994|nr:glycosyltransferase family 4 protein [Terrimonas sp. H1YJ31]
MKIVTTSYAKDETFNNPYAWLKRISFYTGILEKLAADHEVISIERINYEGWLQLNGVFYYFMRLKRNVVFFPWRMHRFIRKQRPDIVLVHGFIFPLQIIQLRLSLGKRPKIIVQNHAEKPASGVRSFFQRLADHVIDAYFFTSPEMAREWTERGIIRKEKKVVEIMEVSSVFSYSEKDRRKNLDNVKGLTFLWVGRLNANKDPITVVKAFVNFLSHQPQARLNMIYQEDVLLNDIKQLIGANRQAAGAIVLAGQVPHRQLQEWYNAADFFISGSHYESGGVAVCEAMSCGCIPVLTNIISFQMMTNRGACGLLYEAGNEKNLLNCLLQTQKMDINKEREKVLEQFNKELSFEAIAQKIDKAITAL